MQDFLILKKEDIQIIKECLGKMEVYTPKDLSSPALDILKNAPVLTDIIGLDVQAERGEQ